MKILNFLQEGAIKINLEAKNKVEVIKELVEILYKLGKVSDKKAAVKVLLDREELGSTGIGQGIAIPHGKTNAVKELVLAIGISKSGIPFNALDDEPVHIFFLLLVPENAGETHLKALAKISSLLKDRHFRSDILNANSPKEIINIIKNVEKTK
jgi:fructose-specific phosphotransferase system IIA component